MPSFNFEKDGVIWSVGALKDILLAFPVEAHGGWQPLAQTSPSGKRLFRCNDCGRVNTAPDKHCAIGTVVLLGEHLEVIPESDKVKAMREEKDEMYVSSLPVIRYE